MVAGRRVRSGRRRDGKRGGDGFLAWKLAIESGRNVLDGNHADGDGESEAFAAAGAADPDAGLDGFDGKTLEDLAFAKDLVVDDCELGSGLAPDAAQREILIWRPRGSCRLVAIQAKRIPTR